GRCVPAGSDGSLRRGRTIWPPAERRASGARRLLLFLAARIVLQLLHVRSFQLALLHVGGQELPAVVQVVRLERLLLREGRGMAILAVLGRKVLLLRLGQQVRRRQGPADPGTKDGQHDEPACRGNLHRWLLLSPGPVPGISCSAARSGAARTISSLEVTIGES